MFLALTKASTCLLSPLSPHLFKDIVMFFSHQLYQCLPFTVSFATFAKKGNGVHQDSLSKYFIEIQYIYTEKHTNHKYAVWWFFTKWIQWALNSRESTGPASKVPLVPPSSHYPPMSTTILTSHFFPPFYTDRKGQQTLFVSGFFWSTACVKDSATPCIHSHCCTLLHCTYSPEFVSLSTCNGHVCCFQSKILWAVLLWTTLHVPSVSYVFQWVYN